jgi:hypothetical protein
VFLYGKEFLKKYNVTRDIRSPYKRDCYVKMTEGMQGERAMKIMEQELRNM